MSSIEASVRQNNNPILRHIRRVKVEVVSSKPELEFFDFIANAQLRIPILFLSLKFHSQFKQYISDRIEHLMTLPSLSSQPPVLILLVDIEDPSSIETYLEQVTNVCLLNGVRLVLGWSAEEGARVLEILHVFGPDRAADIARGNFSFSSSGSDDQLVAQAKEALQTLQGGVGAKNAAALLGHFKSVKNLVQASPEQLVDCPAIGTKKGKHIHSIFNVSW
jgi:DNA excision repair protein ERCC-1